MKATGAPPAVLVHLDDCILDAQCSADAQAANTAQMLEHFQAIFADGQVDERDTEDVLYVFRHTRLEDRLNSEQHSLMKWARVHTNKVSELVAGYRARAQKEKAALASGLQDVQPAR